MKKAFTMIELVIVIVVIGIIAMVTIPKYDQNRVLIAAQQIATHIRYAQHLAMIDNRTNLIAKPAPRPATPRPATDPNGDQWWRERWTIAFTQNTNGGRWGYSIYSDFSRNGSLNSPNEVAPDPQNPNRLLTASNILPANRINNKLNIGKTYGIKNVTFSPSCAQNGNQAISFDEKGRPFLNASTVAVGARVNPSVGRITATCQINIGDGDTDETSTNVATICIEAETGYVTYGMVKEEGVDVPNDNPRRGCNQFQ